MAACLPLTVDGGVAWHCFGGRVVVGVRAVQEGLPALALGERRVEHQPRTRLRIHGTAAWRGTIFWIEAEGLETKDWLLICYMSYRCLLLFSHIVNRSWLDKLKFPIKCNGAHPSFSFSTRLERKLKKEPWQILRHESIQLWLCGSVWIGSLPPGCPGNYTLLTSRILEQVTFKWAKWATSTAAPLGAKAVRQQTWVIEIFEHGSRFRLGQKKPNSVKTDAKPTFIATSFTRHLIFHL